jgi:molecular chaperone DnaK (HSP70)
VQAQQLERLQEAQCEALVDDQLERLMYIFDRHIGNDKKSEKEIHEIEPSVPQWRYNLKGSLPD